MGLLDASAVPWEPQNKRARPILLGCSGSSSLGGSSSGTQALPTTRVQEFRGLVSLQAGDIRLFHSLVTNGSAAEDDKG